MHLIDWETASCGMGVQILDKVGMKYTRNLWIVAFLLGVSLPLMSQSSYVSPGTASSASGLAVNPPDESVLTIKKRVDEVNVLFIATDRHGKFVRDLAETDFAFLDDNKPPQSINNFRRETDLPLQLGLFPVDTALRLKPLRFEKEATVSFLQQTLRPNFDKAFVMGFSGHSQVSQDFTDNVAPAGTRGVPESSQWRRHRSLRRGLPCVSRQVDEEQGQRGTIRPVGPSLL